MMAHVSRSSGRESMTEDPTKADRQGGGDKRNPGLKTFEGTSAGTSSPCKNLSQAFTAS